jgi:ubiquitin-conjugating enzyme E2 D
MRAAAHLRRLMKEKELIDENAEQDAVMFKINQPDENMYHRTAIIFGPSESLYEGYGFELDITLPNDYPTSAMTLKFVTPIQHVNVNSSGNICMDILKDKWTSAQNIRTVLISLISLLADPNTEDPLNSGLRELYKTDKKKYESTIRTACEKSAIKCKK